MDPTLIDSLRGRLVDYLNVAGILLRRQGSRLFGQCPMHDDRTPSFSVFGTKLDRAGCYPCGWNGDVFSFVQWTGRASTFPEAVRVVAGALGVTVDEPRRQRPRVTVPCPVPTKSPVTARTLPPPPAGPDLTYEDFDAAHRRARAALFDACCRKSLRALAAARELGTTVEALRGLTFGSDAVGIEDGRILYLYPTGSKVRRPASCKPRFVWTHGRALLPWRWVFADRPDVATVFVTEGESDAIAAITAGLEDAASRVVASPGTSFPEAWGPLFKGKCAVLLFDRDEPGRKAAQRAASIISPYANRVQIANWERSQP